MGIISFFLSILLSWFIIPGTNIGQPAVPVLPTSLPGQINVIDEKKETSQLKIDRLKNLNGIPFRNLGSPTQGIGMYSTNAQPVDGNYECIVYDTGTFQIYAELIETAGDGSPAVEYINYYTNTEVDQAVAEKYLSSRCS